MTIPPFLKRRCSPAVTISSRTNDVHVDGGHLASPLTHTDEHVLVLQTAAVHDLPLTRRANDLS
jgi:hypothetical protein